MIVVEDIEANEIRRFFVVDASLQLGIVRAGTYIRTFDPDRAFSYYNMVENQLHDFAAGYSGAFRYVPRRAYDYLKKPRFLTDFSLDASELSQSSWLVDLLVANPLIDLGETALPVAQQNANTESVYRWSTVPPTSPRVYHLQDMRQNRRTPQGWGCILRSVNLPLALKGPNRTDLIDIIKSERPVFMELASPESLDLLLEWLVLLKEAGLTAPKLVLKVRSQKEWGKSITRLLDIPDSRLLTAGASISSLSTSISYMKSEQKDPLWSRRLIFASSYPETQLGDSVSEIISYLLSRNLAASPEEVQRILGGNMLSLLPPRPPFLVYTENKTSVMAEESLGKAAMNEIVRLLQLLDAKKILRVVSVDHMVDDEGGTVQLDSVVVTVTGPNGEKGTSISIMLEKNGAVMVSGWKKAFTESISKRDSILLQTLVRASAKLDGPAFGLPAHLAQFDDALLSCLQVEDRKELVAALHFGVEIARTRPGVFLMASSDMESLNVSNDDYVLALGTRTGRWCAGRVREHDMRAERLIVISETDAEIYGFSTSSVVNIVKFQGEISDIRRMVMAYSSDKQTSNQELFSWIHLNESEVLDRIRGRLVGSSSRLFVGSEKLPVTLNITQTEPELVSDQIGVIPEDEVFLRPNQAFRELNVVLCISTCKDMSKRDMKLKTIRAATRELEPLARRIGELRVFLDNLTENASRSEIAALGALLVINLFRHNQTEGRLGFATFAEGPAKFSVQHGSEIKSYVEFLRDVQSEEVLVSLIYSILDSVKDSAGREDMTGAYRTIAEYLDDFGASRPTLVLVFSGGVGREDEEHIPFIKAIKERERYQIEFVTLEKDGPPTDTLRFLKEVNAGVTPLDSFSSQTFIGRILDVIEELVPASSTPEFDA
ncbi:MAG: hypothetical protein C4K48_07600 [Candidatus Thorarchaeota archaeon]|nr:MAG: hypothetical protein C4K48_07600 [Candidatus Thorarchaeota archaeon]